jgi:predicted esterase
MSALRLVVCLLLVLAGTPWVPGHASTQDLPVGRLVGVVSRANPAHRYIVYLPTAYKPGTPRPVLFIMDYRGRGRVAADVFRPAAERYGWILLSSNHSSSDESPEPTFNALRAMWTDAHDRWAIDTKRLYIAGLSGTARTATWIASQLEGSVAGVIGAAAGLSPGMTTADLSPFLYYGTAGDEDYNYWEMRTLERDAAALNLHARVEFFSGPHSWMPPPVAAAAIEWLEIKAMQRGLAPVVPALVEAQWTRDQRAVEMFEDRDRLRAASRRLAQMARDFDGLKPADAIAQAVASGAAFGAEARSQAEDEAERRAKAWHAEHLDRALQALARAYPARSATPAAPVADTIEAMGLRALLPVAREPRGDAALAARRVLAELKVQTGFYLPMQAMSRGEDDRARYYLYLAEAIDPAEPHPWYLRARIAARGGAIPEAIASLRTAVERGFRSLDPLEHDPAFEPLRARKDFQELVARVRRGWQAERPPIPGRRNGAWPR